MRDLRCHNALIFNYKTKELKLINKEYDWQGEYIIELQKSEDQVIKEKELYEKVMEKILDSFVYKNFKSMIKWYFSCPVISLRGDVLPSPNEFILKLLAKNSKWLKIDEDEDLKEVRDSLFDAYFYEERREEKESNNNIK